MASTIPQTGSRNTKPDAASGTPVDMAWDPITRIVRRLWIHTKIDFENGRVVECHSAAS